MNIYEKIQNVKKKFLEANVKKSGKNAFAGYTYYELSDIEPVLINLCCEEKLFTKISFDNDNAMLTIVNIEKDDEREMYTSPMRELSLKGCNDIQALGGTETYQRRYLYMSAFDIVENDMFDAMSSEQNESRVELAKQSQIDFINENATDEQISKILKKFKVKDVSKLNMKQADLTIKNIKEILTREEEA